MSERRFVMLGCALGLIWAGGITLMTWMVFR
jgi:hypothetical protein